MEIKNIFNILLLSLSVTTLVITLISYIIFRLRYSLQKKHSEDVHHLEGAFFRRFAPQLKEVNEIHKKSLETKINKREIWRRRPIFIFIFIGAVITALFSAENYFVYRRELSERVMTATAYRKLLQKGLLKSYDFNPHTKFNAAESFSPAFLERQKFLISALQSKRVQLYSPPENAKDPYHIQAIEDWTRWLNRLKIKATPFTRCTKLHQDELTIAPSLNHISSQNAECLLKLMKGGGAVIITGIAGGGILQSEFGLRTSTNQEATQNHPTIFMSESNLAWDIPPGLLVPWYPLDNRTLIHSDSIHPIAFQTGFGGIRSMPNQLLPARIILKEDNIHRSLWSALDPPREIMEDQNYIDNILLSAMAWTSRVPLSKILSWKNGSKSASVIAIDSENKFMNLGVLAKMIKGSGHPVTAFLVSDLYSENLKLLNFLDASDDLGSHTDNHDGLGAYTAMQNFQRLQESRLDIEENWKNQVNGFHPPEESYEEQELSAVKQSGYKYIFSDQRSFRYSPIFIGENSLILFSRVMDDDVLIKKNRLLETPSQISDYLFGQYEITKRFGGAYIFSLHTHIFGEDQVLQEGFKQFLARFKKETVWKTTFRDLAYWWQERDGLISSVSELEGSKHNEMTLTIHNTGKTDVAGAVVWLTPGKIGAKSILNAVPTTEHYISSEIKCDAENCKVPLPLIPAGAVMNFQFVSKN